MVRLQMKCSQKAVESAETAARRLHYIIEPGAEWMEPVNLPDIRRCVHSFSSCHSHCALFLLRRRAAHSRCRVDSRGIGLAPIRGAALAPRRTRRRSSNTSRRRATDVSATTPRSLSRPGATDDRQQAADSGSGGTDLKSLLLKRASFFHAAKRISSREVMHTASSRSPGISTDERQTRFHVPRCIRAAGPGKTRIRSGAPSSVLPAPAQTPLAVNLCSMLATDLLASRDAVHCILLSSLHRSPSSTDRQVRARTGMAIRRARLFGVQERMVWLSLKSHHELTLSAANIDSQPRTTGAG